MTWARGKLVLWLLLRIHVRPRDRRGDPPIFAPVSRFITAEVAACLFTPAWATPNAASGTAVERQAP